MEQNTIKEVSIVESQPPSYFGESTSMSSLVLDGNSMDKLVKTAELMASSKVTIPSHLRNSPGDCLAVVMQAVQWGMNPFAIAQKTHLTQGGQLGYEAQLISAVLVASGALAEQPDFEFIGNWDKILGKVIEKQSDKGGKYYVANWDKKDEEGLGVIVRARLRNEAEKRKVTIMMTQCYPRFSTQWATDPQQQITYVAVRKFGRRHAPGAILGVYTPEELDESITPEKDITPPNEQIRPTSGAKVAEEAQKSKGTTIDQAQEEKRTALITALEVVARTGKPEFMAEWKKTPRDDRLLIGEGEYVRIFTIAEAAEDAKAV